MLRNLILLGAPGGGKGTIAKKIIKDFSFTPISTGDLIRKHVHEKTALGNRAKKYISEGALVPDEIVVQLLSQEIEAVQKQQKSIILDGFPRTLKQAAILQDNGVTIDFLLNLDIPHETIMERMAQRWIHFASGRTYSYDYNPPKKIGFDDVTGEPLQQREDDKPEVVKARLELYEKTTKPLVHYYETIKTCKVKTFKGTESDVIYPEVRKFLEENL